MPSTIDRTGRVKRTVRRTINAATAADAVGPVTHGAEIYGVSKGQFSLIELIEYLLQVSGPAHLVISTWTAAGADLAHARTLVDNGAILSARWLVDYSFPNRQPGYCQILRERFGDESIRTTANHAKFVLIHNDEWHLVLRTSMNLNLNRRLESYEISDDPEMAAWLLDIIADAFAGDASDIATAHRAPGRAKATSETIGGDIDRRGPEIAFELEGKGVSYD